MRRFLRWVYRSLLFQQAIKLDERDLSRPAIVFAPHPDDEVLGCGGTILRKISCGAEVRIVFLTDGSGSHKGSMGRQAMKEIRAKEAVAAAQKLGVSEGNLHFLAFVDGKLAENPREAVHETARILAAHQPQDVFIPCRMDKPADHWATRDIVLAALDQNGWNAPIYEYPIWFWDHWPWVPAGGNPAGSQALSAWKKSLRQDVRYLLKEFGHAVSIQAVLEEKHSALAAHRSQIARPADNPAWKTLGDVSGGEFLECFFQPYEVFARSAPPGR